MKNSFTIKKFKMHFKSKRLLLLTLSFALILINSNAFAYYDNPYSIRFQGSMIANRLLITTNMNCERQWVSFYKYNRPSGNGVILKLVSYYPRQSTIKYNGTAIGDWMLGENDKLCTLGDFDGDGLSELILQSAWGIGIIDIVGNQQLDSLILVQNDRRMGGWLLGSNDEIIGSGDLNGNGKDEFLIKSDWGIGLIEYNDGGLSHIAANRYRTRMGSWYLNSNDEIVAVGDFCGDDSDEFLIQSDWGFGIIEYDNGEFKSVTLKDYYSYLDSWQLLPGDKVGKFIYEHEPVDAFWSDGNFHNGKNIIAIRRGYEIAKIAYNNGHFEYLGSFYDIAQ